LAFGACDLRLNRHRFAVDVALKKPRGMGGAHRQAAVLARLASKVGWGAPTPKDVGLGIATTFGQERAMPTGWPVLPG
jgi:hypothetical protein